MQISSMKPGNMEWKWCLSRPIATGVPSGTGSRGSMPMKALRRWQIIWPSSPFNDSKRMQKSRDALKECKNQGMHWKNAKSKGCIERMQTSRDALKECKHQGMHWKNAKIKGCIERMQKPRDALKESNLCEQKNILGNLWRKGFFVQFGNLCEKGFLIGSFCHRILGNTSKKEGPLQHRLFFKMWCCWTGTRPAVQKEAWQWEGGWISLCLFCFEKKKKGEITLWLFCVELLGEEKHSRYTTLNVCFWSF